CISSLVACITCLQVFFFFQAEDGIRDFHVTGVQTCALPISERRRSSRSTSTTASWRRRRRWAPPTPSTPAPPTRSRPSAPSPTRSEERRVGKECRTRRAAEPRRKKTKKEGSDREGRTEKHER